MKLYGYARVSDDDQISIPNQKRDIREFIETEDDYEYGGTHTLVGIESDDGTTGTKRAPNREGMSKIIDELKADSSIDGIVVWKMKRFSRNPIDWLVFPRRLRRDILMRNVEILQVEPWLTPHRAVPSLDIEEWKKSEKPLDKRGKAMMYAIHAFEATGVPLFTSERVKRTMRHKTDDDDPIGNLSRGIISDKHHPDFENEQATMRLPGEEFEMCIDILNEYSTSERSAYSIGKEYGLSSPSRAVKNMWERRDRYLEAARNDPNNDWDILFSESD